MKTLRIVTGKQAKESPIIRIAVPNQKRTSGNLETTLPDIGKQSSGKLMRFDAAIDITGKDSKSFKEIKEDGRIIDYQDVTIKGYLSTFGNFDRDGETVKPGAFADTISDFMRNPVMLTDHRNSVGSQAGSFTVVREDQNGLYVEGKVCNGNTEFLKQVRALVAEGHLKTLSMGGVFYYEPDGRVIFKVSLFEGTLTPIPANPKAIISVREVTEHEAKWWQFSQSCETTAE